MKRFLIKTGLMVSPIILAALVMEILLRLIPNDYRLKRNYLDNHAADIETLVLGSSHSFAGFNPECMSTKAFNAAYISQALNYDVALFEKYQDQLISLKTIVLPMSYFTLYTTLEDGYEPWRLHKYVIYYGLDKAQTLSDYSELFSNKLNINLERLSSYYLRGVSNITATEKGWNFADNSAHAQDLVETGKAAALRHTKDIHSASIRATYKKNVEILKSIITWGKTHHVNIILVTTPAFETYRQNLNAEQLDETIETATALASAYDNCTYLNLLNDTNFVAKDYYDADHLAESGAQKLSLLLETYLKK